MSTIPMPLVSRMVPDLPERSKARYDGIKNIGVACLIFKLKTSVTPHFWVNITDQRIEHTRHCRVLEPQADERHDRVRALLHAGHESEVGVQTRIFSPKRSAI